MKLLQEIKLGKSDFEIHHKTRMMSVGSCFSTHIAKKFSQLWFEMQRQPFGQLYNPLSITNAIEILIQKKTYKESDLFFYQEQYHCFDFHSNYSKEDTFLALNHINEEVKEFHRYLKTIEVLFITLGSAFVFENLATKKVVANCHKLPAANFSQRRLKLSEITASLNNMICSLRIFNPSLKVVFTVSPVRYLAFGEHENQLGKATLLLAIDEVIKQHAHSSYFPSYEIILDELRDYRFFETDFSHPTAMAVDYVWNKLADFYFDKKTQQIIDKIRAIEKRRNHRVVNSSSDANVAFQQLLVEDTLRLENEIGKNS